LKAIMVAYSASAASLVDVTLVAKYHVANIDGSFLRVPLFNGTYPGPPIECAKGDTLRINVINDMKKEELSVNWQGIVQNGTNHMDGVPYITENPIASGGGSRVYMFAADAAGTFHYHSNQEFIRSGLHGIIIVKEPSGSGADPVFDRYGEYEDLVAVQSSGSSSPTYPALLATDLYHKDGATLASQLDNGIGDWIWQPQSLVVNGWGLYDCSVKYDSPYYFRCTWQCPSGDVECIDEVRCSKAAHPNDGRLLGPYVWEEKGSNALYDELVAGIPDLYTEEVQLEWASKCGLDHILPFLYGTENEQEVDGRPVGANGVHQNQFLNWGRPTGMRCDVDPDDRDPRCLADGTWPFKGLNKGRTYDHLRMADGKYDAKHFDEADLAEYNATCRATRFYTCDAQPEGNHGPFGLWGQSPLRCEDYPQAAKKSESPAVFEVEAGKLYRLRAVNVASLVYSTLVIEGHSMIVVQVDGAYVEPFETNFLDLWNGQTYSILLKADSETQGDFWIGLGPRHRGYTRIEPGRAILRYVTRDSSTGKTAPVAAEDARLPADKSRPVPKWWDAAPKGKYSDADSGKKPIACPMDLHSTINDVDRNLDRCPGFYPHFADQDISMELQFKFKSLEGMYQLPDLSKSDEEPVMITQNMNTNGYRDSDTYAACASDYGNSEVKGTYENAFSYAPFLGDQVWSPLQSKFRPGTDIAGQQSDLCGVQRWSVNNITYPFRYVDFLAEQATEVGNQETYKKPLLEHAYDNTLDNLTYVVDVRRPDETPYFSSFPEGYYNSLDSNELGGRTKEDQGIPVESHELYNIMRFDLGDVFDVVMQNTAYLRYWTNAFYGDKHNHRSGSNHHPYHSHGFNFWVLGYGEGNFKAEAWNEDTAVNSETGPNEYDGGIIWHKNIVNPPMRNLAVNFAGGWTVLRIKADNPGLWWFHCTVMSHFHMGMGTTFGFGLNNLPRPNPFMPVDVQNCNDTSNVSLGHQKCFPVAVFIFGMLSAFLL